MADLEKAATLADLGKQVGGVAGRLIKTLKGTSRSSGYSKESAKFHRRQHWALCDYFGLPAVFLTITPCDECTFRVRLFADAGNPHVLPKLVEDPFSIEATEICDADFKLRSKQRTMYPGACALVYESLMQIVIKCLLGWNSEEQRGGQVGGEGILSTLEAWARTDEEQGRKTLHGHWLLWVANINEIREALHSKDPAQREAVRQSFYSTCIK